MLHDPLNLDHEGALVLPAVAYLLDGELMARLWAEEAHSPGGYWALLTLFFRRLTHGLEQGDLTPQQEARLAKAMAEADKTTAEAALPNLEALLAGDQAPGCRMMLRALLDVDDLICLVVSINCLPLGKALAHLAASHIERAPTRVAGLRRFAKVWLETLGKGHPSHILWSCVLDATPIEDQGHLEDLRILGK